MTKSQRSRLAALLAKGQDKLTAEEGSELTRLQALAAQHPDASKDRDDDPADNAQQPAAATAAAAPTVRTVVAAALNSLRSRNANAADLATASQQVATLTTERDQARTERDEAQANVATLNAQLAVVAAFFGVTAAELVGKTDDQVRAVFQEKLSAAAQEQVAALGFPANKLPSTHNADDTGTTSAELLRQYNDIKDPEARAAYWEQHKSKMLN